MVISREVEELNTDKSLYQALKHVAEKGDVEPTDEVDKTVAKFSLFDFGLSGIHLPENDRNRILE